MANQIARNLAGRCELDDAADKTADHLQRFWTPGMRKRLLDYWRTDGVELSPVVSHMLASERLRME
jgi:formate dehydrogenase subunit delta